MENQEVGTDEVLGAICSAQQGKHFYLSFTYDEETRNILDPMINAGLVFFSPLSNEDGMYTAVMTKKGYERAARIQPQGFNPDMPPIYFLSQEELDAFLDNVQTAEAGADSFGLDKLHPMPEDMPDYMGMKFWGYSLRLAVYILTHQQDKNGFGGHDKICRYIVDTVDKCMKRRQTTLDKLKKRYGEEECHSQNTEHKESIDITPKEIKSYLDSHIIGQEDAKKQASVILWSHMNGIKRNALFAGPSGCGKTEIFRQLKSIFKDIYIYDVSNVTTSGFKGNKKADSVFSDLIEMGVPIKNIEHSVIVFDEFDKMCVPSHTAQGDNVSRQNQGEFLSMIEGTDLSTPDGVIDTRNISFVFLGAFEDIFLKKKAENETHHIGFGQQDKEKQDEYSITIDDLIDYGVRTEIAGRIMSITRLNKLTADDYVELMKNPGMSPIIKAENAYGIKLNIPEEEIRKMAEEASEKGLGARWLQSEVMMRCDKEIYEGKAKIGKQKPESIKPKKHIENEYAD